MRSWVLRSWGEYTAGDDLMQMCYAFEFLAKDQPTAARIVASDEQGGRGRSDGWACWAFSNHDVIRHASRWDLTPAAQRMFATLIMCLRGSVCIYQGEELGLPEADVAFEDLQDPYGIEFWPEFKGRDGCRTPMVWESSNQNGGFSAAKPWLPVAQNICTCPPPHKRTSRAHSASLSQGDRISSRAPRAQHGRP